MKKIIFGLIICTLFLSASSVFAKSTHRPSTYTHHPHHYHSSSSSNYIVRSDYIRDEHTFPDCIEHSLIKETTVNYYSNGSKRVHSRYTILGSKGAVLESDCTDVKHSIYDNKHYIVFKKGKYYKIMEGNGNIISTRNYKKLSELSKNRLLARIDKKYGIIDLNENIIVPIKYKSFESANSDLYIVNLNGYYGILNSENNIFLTSEFDKIKPLYDTYIVKKQGKYGLVDITGKLILDPEHDKITSLGEYILVKKAGKYGLLDYSGKPILALTYKKIKQKRNVLYAKNQNNEWITVNSNI
ncbi:MAG: WG repeat-containing protein [Candidatus Gastranaerophilales bacterium]|nr:WG repeat-containing protein [Candidatus Gastranaerophilales bacterium]